MLTGKQPVAPEKEYKIRRSNNVVCYWHDGSFVIENFLTGKQAIISPLLLPVVECLSEFMSQGELEKKFPTLPDIPAITKQLLDFGIIYRQNSPDAALEELLDGWKWGVDAKYYHLKTNYVNFECNNESVWKSLAIKGKAEPAPSPFFLVPDVIYLALPSPGELPDKKLQEVLNSRRTCRSYLSVSISINQLSDILYYCWGMTGKYEGGDLGDVIFKHSPSGGSRHPTEVYFIANNIDGLECGIYHYSVLHHSIGLIKKGSFEDLCVDICSGQKWVRKAAVVFILTAILKRTMWKYEHSHAFRVIHLDNGHLGQTFHLVAECMGLGPFTTAATNNALIEKLLGINPIEQPVIYLCAAGYKNYLIETDD